jgi:hypothetical protein
MMTNKAITSIVPYTKGSWIAYFNDSSIFYSPNSGGAAITGGF